MLQVLLRNVLTMLGVALPISLASALLIGWLKALVSGRHSGTASSLSGVLAGFEETLASLWFMYVIWALPTLAIAAIHQLVLAALPRHWPPRVTRRAVMATSLGLAGAIAGYVTFASSAAHGLRVALALLPAAAIYGALAQPLRPPVRTEECPRGGA